MQRLGNWLSSTGRDVLGQLAESVAPLFRTNLEQFQFAWKKIDEEYGHMMAQADVDLDDPTVLTNSKMVDHLNTLVEALVKEEEEQSSKNRETGPCFEFLLERGVLDKLCALGLPDRPPGMRVLVTKTLDAVLQHTQHPILPNMHIHAAVRQFIDVSFKQDDLHKRRAKSSYVSLLKTLCIKVRDDPSLAGIFFDEHAEQKGAKPDFMLFGALLSVANNEDEDGRAACEGLLCCLQVPHLRMAKWIVDGSPFCQLIVKGLCERWDKMPKVLKSDIVDELPKENPTIDAFYERLAYIDIIAACSYPIVGAGIAKCFVEQFLHRCLQPRLMDVEEKTATCATVYLRRIVQKLDAYHIVNPLLNFLLSDGSNEETKADEKLHVIRTTLIKRMDSLSEPLTLSTLALFDSLIAMKNQSVISNLVLRNLVPLHHIDSARRADYKPILAGTGDGKEGPALRKRMLAPFGTLAELDKHASYEDYLVDAQAEGQMWFSAVERWEPMGRSPLAEPHVPSLSLPAISSSTSSTTVTASSDAAAAAAAPSTVGSDATSTPSADSPATPATATSTSTTAIAAESEWYEGLFMCTLLNKLETLMDNSFRTNLRLTAVFAKLAFCPHPLLNNYLLDPSIPVRASVRLPLKLLGDVWTRAQTRAARLPNFAKRLEDMRTRLNAEVPPPAGTSVATGETLESEKFFAGLILLEEFAKELLSVSQAHSNLHAMQALALKAMELPRGKKSEEEEDADKMALLKMASGPVTSSSSLSSSSSSRVPVKPIPSAASSAAAAAAAAVSASPAARRAATPGAANPSSLSSSRSKPSSLLTPNTTRSATSSSSSKTSPSSTAGLNTSISPRPGSARATTSSAASPAKR